MNTMNLRPKPSRLLIYIFWLAACGLLLLPSRLLAQQVITPISVKATSQWTVSGDGSRENIINGNGLSGGGSVFMQVHDASNSAGTMWHVGGNDAGLGVPPNNAAPEVNGIILEFDLGTAQDLSAVHVWNMNQAGNIGRGIKDVQIQVSPDATSAFTTLLTTQFTQGTGTAGLAAQRVPLAATNVRRVRFVTQSVWSGLTSDYVGLSEVRFASGRETVGTNLGPIPDSDLTGRDILFNVTGTTGVVQAVSVQITFNPGHTRMDNLRIQLFSPSGASAWIFASDYSRPPGLAGPYTLVDSAVSTLYGAAWNNPEVLPSGHYLAGSNDTPAYLNITFGGTAPNGTWRLNVVDRFDTFSTGTVSQASLTLTTDGRAKATITRQSGNAMQVQMVSAAPSTAYLLRRSPDLQTWSPLKLVTTDALGSASHLDAGPPVGKAFYQFKIPDYGPWTLFQNVANGEVAQRFQELQQTFPQKEWRWVPAASGRSNIEYRDYQ